VRGYIDDSDPSNIDRVGHRAWATNPTMLRTGFGHEKGFTAMWATDTSRPTVPDYTFVAVPPAGHAPGPWFGATWAWSVALNPARFDAPVPERVKVRVEPVGEDFLPTGPPLAFDFSNVKSDSVGIPYLLIFRPVEVSLEPGRRYRVLVEGLAHKGKARDLRYFVEFFDLPYVTPAVPGAASR
jgi:hypothetical protein